MFYFIIINYNELIKAQTIKKKWGGSAWWTWSLDLGAAAWLPWALAWWASRSRVITTNPAARQTPLVDRAISSSSCWHNQVFYALLRLATKIICAAVARHLKFHLNIYYNIILSLVENKEH